MIHSKKDMKYYISEDLKVNGIDRFRMKYIITKPTVYWLRLLRKTEYYKNRKAKIRYVFWKILFMRQSVKLGFSIPENVLGFGVRLPHYGTIVINKEAHIDDYVSLFPGVNIGHANGGAPNIGKHCIVMPGAKLYGPISIGDNVIIGTNAVVNKDVTSNKVVAGVPAVVIRDTDSGTYNGGITLNS